MENIELNKLKLEIEGDLRKIKDFRKLAADSFEKFQKGFLNEE